MYSRNVLKGFGIQRCVAAGVLCLCAFVPVCAGQTLDPAANRQEQVRRMQAAPKRGLLYETSFEKNLVYVFGTIHVGKAEFYPLNVATVRALSSSAFLVVEADTQDQAVVAKQIAELTMLPSSSSLDRYVTPLLMNKVTRLLERYQFPKERAIQMKPWMLATTLATLEAKHSGYDPGWATEAFLLGFARAQKKPVIEMEGLSLQFEIFNGLSADEQLAFLEETVNEIEKGSVERRTRALADAWARGRAVDLEKVRQDLRQSQSTFGKFFSTKMLDERNATMAAHIDDYLHSGKPHFVAVGVLHLVGEKNIIDLLKGRGYLVREL
jgi:uncharacterized protein YbaP (TraB family)